jgi:hypothetical protein
MSCCTRLRPRPQLTRDKRFAVFHEPFRKPLIDGFSRRGSKPSAQTKQRRGHRLPLSPPALELLGPAAQGRDASPLGCSLARSRASRCGNCGGCHRAAVGFVRRCRRAETRRRIRSRVRAGAEIKKCRADGARREITLPTGLSDVRIYDLRRSFCEWRGRRRIEPADRRACVSFP